MTDREKVIEALQYLISGECTDTQFDYLDEIEAAIAMLKEQEPVEPKEIVNEHFPVGDFRRTNGWLCGKCGNSLVGDGNYCSYCGQAVKWE